MQSALRLLYVFVWIAPLFRLVNAGLTWQATPLSPPSYPLAVRHPYLQAWLKAGPNDGHLANWPTGINGGVWGWAGYIRVDGTPYIFLGGGVSSSRAVQKSATFTATQSIFVLQTGPVDITATFLSPIEPNDLVRQSLPFSYLTLSVKTNDGSPHNVQLYTDISGEWLAGDGGLNETWSTTINDDFGFHEQSLSNRLPYQESKDRILDGSAYHATLISSSTTYQTGSDNDLRVWFQSAGRLNNTKDTAFRAISDQWPVFAFAHDLGSITTTVDPIITAVGHDRDPLIRYNDGVGEKTRHAYWRTQYSSIGQAIQAFLKDYQRALEAANAFDKKLHDDAAKISEDYATILALSARQVFGAVEITVGKDSSGSFNANDVIVFMKEISSSGNIQTVDVIFPSLPAFLYTNPALGKALLEPILQREANGANKNNSCVHDLGMYPNATGNTGESMPIEETSNMIIMALALAQATNNTAQLDKYYDVFDKYATFLVGATPQPELQLSSDDFAGALALQSNLALKGIIGLASMVKIAGLLGRSTSGKPWANITQSYADQWLVNARSADQTHITLTFGDNTSWTLLYNLYADRLVHTNVFQNTNVAAMQTQWYQSVTDQYGVPLDSRNSWAKSDWMMFTAATVTDTTVRDMFITRLVNFVVAGGNQLPLPDLYDSQTGEAKSFKARPVVGGHFAFLALSQETQSDNSQQQVPQSNRPDSSAVGLVTWSHRSILPVLVACIAGYLI